MSVAVTGDVESGHELSSERSDVEISAPDPSVEDPVEDPELGIEPNDEQLAQTQKLLELRYARSELLNVMREARKKGILSKIKAEIFRVCNIAFLIFLVACSAAMFVVTSVDPRRENIPIIVVSAISTAMLTIYGIIGPGGRGTYYNQISVRLRGMFRTARESLVKLNNSDEMLELVNLNMAEMDQMDLNIYSMGLGTNNGASTIARGAGT
uniref:Uncharacterized protein n=1 Tax=Pithovirus LCPAC103 TaxID=2506588 RepID=A0A481Z5K8_9VIRU|nr:MAG: hypothetical protein LCPAC103_00310 [Pithovirus LCPAC103]